MKLYHPKSMESKEYLEKLKTLHSNKTIQKYSEYLMKTLTQLLKGQNIETIFDIGSGSGNNSYLLRNTFKGSTVYSIDYVQHNLDHGVKKGLIQNPVRSDIYELQKTLIEKNLKSADIIFLGDIVEHLNDEKQAFKNIYSAVKQGGSIIIHTPNKLYTSFFRIPEDPTHVHEYEPKELYKTIKSYGFDIQYFVPSGIPFVNKFFPLLSQKLAYSWIGRLLFKIIPVLGPSILVVAQKK